MSRARWAVVVAVPLALAAATGVVGATSAAAADAASRDASFTPNLRVTNGTGLTVHARGDGAEEVVIPPGGQKDLMGLTGRTVSLETLASPAGLPNDLTVAEIGKGVGVAAELGRLVVQNSLGKRIEVHVDGSWASALGDGAAFTQDMKAGTYTFGIYDGEDQGSLLERTLAIRDGTELTWVIGKEGRPESGFVTVKNLMDTPLQVTLNQVDRGRVMPGAERTLLDILPKAQGDAPPTTIQTGDIWGDGTQPIPARPAAPPAAQAAPPADPGVQTMEQATGLSTEDLQKARDQNHQQVKVGTIRVGNQTNHRLKIYVNGEEVGWLDPNGELTLEEQAMGDYQVEAEDARAGAFVRARLTISRPGQIVVWNATGWW